MIQTATVRSDIADFIQTLAFVYVILLIAYIFSQMYFAFGGRLPYAKWSSAVLDFLRQVADPFLAIFRRFIPTIGPIDISPIFAIIVVQLVAAVVAGAIDDT
jgi:YggT family protein